MKPITGFESKAPSTKYPMLPKGLYIAQIKGVKMDGAEPDQRIVLRLDIVEGEYAGYYTARYNSESNSGSQYAVTYKGDYFLQVPDNANPRRPHFEWDYKAFQNAIWAIEDSNDGYHWDWNEAGLKGKIVGINVRQGEFNGNPYTRIGRLESVKMIKAGMIKIMQDMAPRSDGSVTTTASTTSSNTFTAVVDEEVPF